MMRYIANGTKFPEKAVSDFLSDLARYDYTIHSLLIARGDDVVFEKYWAPFDANRPHRLYSVTKSFVSVAIGCLAEEGRISLDAPIVSYFPDKLPEELPDLLKKQTVRHMLMMSTCLVGVNWFQPGVYDRTRFYFTNPAVKPAGTLFDYDSNGSYILSALVERVTGMTLLDYLKSRCLNRIGGFEDAVILKTPDGASWGDSALVATPRALMNFARLVMNGGAWEGEQLLPRDYLAQATSCQTPNNLDGCAGHDHLGYGYQFWMTYENSYAMLGMGGQYAICIPEKDLIVVTTGDNQYNKGAAEVFYRAVFDRIAPAVPGEQAEVPALSDELRAAQGAAESPFAEKINGKAFTCRENPMGIKWFRLVFRGAEGEFRYENAQGEKAIPFGMQKNVFCKFPEEGYSDDRGNVHEITDFRYDCAASSGWLDEHTLQLRVQIIDRYLGSLIATFGFSDENTAGVRMTKSAEDFLSTYDGWMIGEAQ